MQNKLQLLYTLVYNTKRNARALNQLKVISFDAFRINVLSVLIHSPQL